jgi:hypothetical protein
MENIELQPRPAVRRRAWGRGSIEPSGPDKWVVRLSHRRDPATGRRVRDSRTVRGTRRDAERVLADMVRERETHGPTPTSGGRITLDAWIKQRIATADISDRTRADDLDTWSRYSSPALRSTPLRDLSTAALEAYVAELRERVSDHTNRKLAPRTVQMFVSVVRAALNAAVRQRVIPANPARGVVVKGGTATSKVGQALTRRRCNASSRTIPRDGCTRSGLRRRTPACARPKYSPFGGTTSTSMRQRCTSGARSSGSVRRFSTGPARRATSVRCRSARD